MRARNLKFGDLIKIVGCKTMFPYLAMGNETINCIVVKNGKLLDQTCVLTIFYNNKFFEKYYLANENNTLMGHLSFEKI